MGPTFRTVLETGTSTDLTLAFAVSPDMTVTAFATPTGVEIAVRD